MHLEKKDTSSGKPAELPLNDYYTVILYNCWHYCYKCGPLQEWSCTLQLWNPADRSSYCKSLARKFSWNFISKSGRPLDALEAPFYHVLCLKPCVTDYIFYLATKGDQEPYKVQFTEKELKERLTPQEYHVTQKKGTERCVLCTTFLGAGSQIDLLTKCT